MFSQKLALVDVETTGAGINYDRIIEIGIIRVEDGKVVSTYESLVNPQAYVSPFIESLTGIKNIDLERAPTFRQIHLDILEMIKDCVFVAHNARFDYGMLKSEFRKLEKSISLKPLCTVKLSRLFFPRFKHHDLDSIINRFNIVGSSRHRALPDAKVIWEFLKIIQSQFSEEKIKRHLQVALKRPSIPINLSQNDLDSLPGETGVYIFYDKDNTPLYVGKSVNIRDRILSHFSQDYTSSQELALSQEVGRIETIQTAGELGALFRESTLIKALQPIYNRKLRYARQLIVAKKGRDENGYDTLSLETVNEIDVATISDILGIFKSKAQAKKFLASIAKTYSLCEKLLKLEKTKSACFAYRLGWCKGACIGKEKKAIYNARFIIAMSKSKIRSWPFKGPIIIKERNTETNSTEAFLIDKWCYLGTVKYNGDNSESFFENEIFFDLDTYKILTLYLKSPRNFRNIKEVNYLVLKALGIPAGWRGKFF